MTVLVMLDPLVITCYFSEWASGGWSDTRHARHECVCELLCKTRTWRKEVRAWISGGCVPLVQVSPFSARTDGSRAGVGAGAATTNLVGQLELSTRKCRESSLVPASSLPFPIPHFPAADQTLFPTGSLSEGVCWCVVCVHASTLLRWDTQSHHGQSRSVP